MRCNECNVDLGEEYTKCPLCGADAVPDEPKLKGIKTAEYPKYDQALLDEPLDYHTTFPQKYVLRLCLCTCIVCIAAALSSVKSLWIYGVPAVMTFSSLFYFIYSFKEKGRLLHSALGLLSTGAFLAVFTVAAAIAGSGLKTMLIALAVCAVLFGVLAVIKSERLKEQLKAAFNI